MGFFIFIIGFCALITLIIPLIRWSEKKHKSPLFYKKCVEAGIINLNNSDEVTEKLLNVAKEMYFSFPVDLRECYLLGKKITDRKKDNSDWQKYYAQEANSFAGKLLIVALIAALCIAIVISLNTSSSNESKNKYDDVFKKDPNTWTEDEKEYVNDLFEWTDEQDKNWYNRTKILIPHIHNYGAAFALPFVFPQIFTCGCGSVV